MVYLYNGGSSELIVLLDVTFVGRDFLGWDSFFFGGGCLLRVGLFIVIGIFLYVLRLLIDILIILVYHHIFDFIVQLLLTLLIFLFF